MSAEFFIRNRCACGPFPMTPPLPMREMSWLEFALSNSEWIRACLVLIVAIFALLLLVVRSDWWLEEGLKQVSRKIRKDFSKKFAELKKKNPNDAEARYSLQA